MRSAGDIVLANSLNSKWSESNLEELHAFSSKNLEELHALKYFLRSILLVTRNWSIQMLALLFLILLASCKYRVPDMCNLQPPAHCPALEFISKLHDVLKEKKAENVPLFWGLNWWVSLSSCQVYFTTVAKV